MCINKPVQKPSSRVLFALDAEFHVPSFIRFRKSLISIENYYWQCSRNWFEERKPLFRQFAPAFVGCSITFAIEDPVRSKCIKPSIYAPRVCKNTETIALVKHIIPELFAHCGSYKLNNKITKSHGGPYRRNWGEKIDIATFLSPEPVKRCARVKIKHRNWHVDCASRSGLVDDAPFPWFLFSYIFIHAHSVQTKISEFLCEYEGRLRSGTGGLETPGASHLSA